MWKSSGLSTARDRYWMPEFPPVILNLAFNSKSFTVPSQTRKLLPPGIRPSFVYPVIAPSLTDHRSGLPFQPVRSLPLNRLSHSCPNAATGRAKSKVSASGAGERMGIVLSGGGGGLWEGIRGGPAAVHRP